MVIKFAIDTVPPATMTLSRVAIGAVMFAAILLATGRRLAIDYRTWVAIIAASLFGLALPFTLISWGEERIDAGLAAILMAGMPLMTIVLAHFFSGGEPITFSKVIGVGLGIVGLVVLIGPYQLVHMGGDTIHEFAIVAAALCYAINAVVMKNISRHDPYVISAAMMIVATLFMLPAALILDEPWNLSPTRTAWIALAILGVVPTALAGLVMLAVLRRQGAGFFAQINFLVPLFGVAWGAMILSERPPPSALLALFIILLGIAMSRGAKGPSNRPISETSNE